jgi:CheY-like chemotaxis protein
VRREAEHAPVAKKSYSKPRCISRSPSELVQLLRERLSAQVQSRNVRSPAIERPTPILLVQDYGGDSRSIQDAARRQNLRGRSCEAASGSELVRMVSRGSERTGAERSDFLVLDLRAHGGNAPAILREINSEPIFGGVPLAILTSADFATELAERELRAARCAWQMSGVSDPAQVVQALKAVLRLWADGQKLPASSQSVP